MIGRSLYDFPEIGVLQERNEKQVMTNFETETKRMLGEGDKFALAMVDHEKTEN